MCKLRTRNDITNCINVADICTALFINFNNATLSEFNTNFFKTHFIRIWTTTNSN